MLGVSADIIAMLFTAAAFTLLGFFIFSPIQRVSSDSACPDGRSCPALWLCCEQGCCAPATVPPRRDPDREHRSPWYAQWPVLFLLGTLGGILICCVWCLACRRGHRVYMCSLACCVRRPASDLDSAGSVYPPPRYSRCGSFHQAPPPYSEVTSKPDLFPLVITCEEGDGKAGGNYLMVHYFRNYVIRAPGSISATSTAESLSSSFICNAANEANTVVPPPYSAEFEPWGCGLLRSLSSLTEREPRPPPRSRTAPVPRPPRDALVSPVQQMVSDLKDEPRGRGLPRSLSSLTEREPRPPPRSRTAPVPRPPRDALVSPVQQMVSDLKDEPRGRGLPRSLSSLTEREPRPPPRSRTAPVPRPPRDALVSPVQQMVSDLKDEPRGRGLPRSLSSLTEREPRPPPRSRTAPVPRPPRDALVSPVQQMVSDLKDEPRGRGLPRSLSSLTEREPRPPPRSRTAPVPRPPRDALISPVQQTQDPSFDLDLELIDCELCCDGACKPRLGASPPAPRSPARGADYEHEALGLRRLFTGPAEPAHCESPPQPTSPTQSRDSTLRRPSDERRRAKKTRKSSLYMPLSVAYPPRRVPGARGSSRSAPATPCGALVPNLLHFTRSATRHGSRSSQRDEENDPLLDAEGSREHKF